MLRAAAGLVVTGPDTVVTARYRNDEELVTGGRMRISNEYGHVALHIFYTFPEDEGRYVCR